MSNRMQDSFFGFNTAMPAISKQELSALESGVTGNDGELSSRYLDDEDDEQVAFIDVDDDDVDETEMAHFEPPPMLPLREKYPTHVPLSRNIPNNVPYDNPSIKAPTHYQNVHMSTAGPMMPPLPFYPPGTFMPSPVQMASYPPYGSLPPPVKYMSVDELEKSFISMAPPSQASFVPPPTMPHQAPLKETGVKSQSLGEFPNPSTVQEIRNAVQPSLLEIIMEQKKQRERERNSPQPVREIVRSYEERPRVPAARYVQSRSFHDGASKRPPGSIMTIADKDLVKRILMAQVSTDDPYTDDFYFHSLRAKRENMSALLPNPNASRKWLKESELVFEQTLGKIPLPSVRNPRRVLQFDQSYQYPESVLFHRYQITVLKSIEAVYAYIMEMDDLEKLLLVSSPELQDSLLSRQADIVAGIYQKIFQNTDSDGHNILPDTRDKFLLHFIQQPKGKKALKRALPLLSAPQMSEFVVWVFTHLGELDVVVQNAKEKDIDLFMNTVATNVMRFLAHSSSLPFLTSLLTACTQGNRTRRLLISKVAVSLLATLLQHASEEMNEGYSTEITAEWTRSFSEFFDMHRTQFNDLFSIPTMPILWDFLSKLASFASYEHKIVLVTELRDSLLQAAQQFKSAPYEGLSVNVFLYALGLDADQLT